MNKPKMETCPDCRRPIIDEKGHLRGCIYHEHKRSRHPFGNWLAEREADG